MLLKLHTNIAIWTRCVYFGEFLVPLEPCMCSTKLRPLGASRSPFLRSSSNLSTENAGRLSVPETSDTALVMEQLLWRRHMFDHIDLLSRACRYRKMQGFAR